MLNGVHFYHATIKRVVSVFGTIFNNIRVGRHNGNNISNIARVPISYGPRQKFLARVNEKLDEQKVAIKLPRMSFEITSIDYDTSTKLNKLNTTLLPTDNNSPLKRKRQYQSVPYILGMQLNIMARNQEDALQVLEQILPTFTPEYTVTIKDIDGPNSKTDVPFILNSVSLQDDYEGDFQGRRTIVYTLDFTVKIRFAPDTSDANIIKKVETHIADFTNVASSANAVTLSTVNVSADSPADKIRTFTSMINPSVNQTITLAPSSISLSGLGSITSVSGISITSGNTPDFDRIEDEDFNIAYDNLAGTGGSGSSSSFSTVVNGLTGETKSVNISLSGLHFVVGDQITINDSPYDTTPLVLSVSSVDTPAGAGQSPNASPVGDDGSPINEYGKITGVTFVSGNTAIADRAENYSPIFEREVIPTLENFTGDNTPSGLILNAKINKLGTVTEFEIVNGGTGYDTPNQLRVSAFDLGETQSSYTINASPTGGAGSGAILQFELATQTGGLSNLTFSGPGAGYAVNDLLTVDRTLISANTPNADTPSTNMVARVTAINASPAEIVSDTPSGQIDGIEFVNGDTPQIDRVQGLWDSPYNDILLNVTSVDTFQTDGLYKRNGSLNLRPKYVMDSPIDSINDTPDNNNLTISFDGNDWLLKFGNRTLASHSTDTIDPPITDWRDEVNPGGGELNFSTTDNTLFGVDALITGNVSLGTAVVVSHNSPNRLIVNNLEAEYTDGEIITSNSGISRTVFKSTIS